MKITLKHIFAEIRPALQSVNVYVVFTAKISEQLKVELTTNGFNLIQNNSTESFEFLKETQKANLIILSATQNHLVFRFNISNFSSSGSLKAEVINLQKSFGEFKLKSDLNNFPVDAKKISNDVKVECVKKIECKNGCMLNRTDIKRAFKSPHFDYEPNEWFCHAHNVPDYSLKPNIFELQITDYGYYVDKKLVEEDVVNQERRLFCKKCALFLGREVNEGVYKFYPDSVKTLDETFKLNELSLYKSDQFNVSLYSTLKIIMDGAQRNLGKVILTTSECNPKLKQYLYIWVAEKNLQTYKTDGDSKNFKEELVNKVLFQYENGLTEIVDKWCKDFSTVLIDISETMLEEILRYLKEGNNLIPEEFGSANGLSVSYFSTSSIFLVR